MLRTSTVQEVMFRDDSPEWITRDIVHEIPHKDHLYKLAKRTDAKLDWENFHEQKNEVKKLLKCKGRFYQRSTSLAIFQVLKELYANWNDKVFSGCVFIDFSRAFDSINHNYTFSEIRNVWIGRNS